MGDKAMESKSFLKVTVECKDIECVKNAIKIINNHVYENGMDSYSDAILKALLGENYQNEWFIGFGK